MKLIVRGGGLRGEVDIAADKSISHRAVLLAALADGTSRLRNVLRGEDVLALMRALRQMGVVMEDGGDSNSNSDGDELIVHGVGLRGLCAPMQPLDLGNSGTAMRLLAGVLCAQPWASVVTGDESLRARPMARIIAPLRQMGARIEGSGEASGKASGEGEDDKPPLRIAPGGRLRAIEYAMPIASAQVKSCLLLAGLYADGETRVHEPAPTRDHSERMLRACGAKINVADGVVGVRAAAQLNPFALTVPADLSAAAFFLVGASIARDGDVTLRGVGVNPSRNGVLDILTRMGADIRLINEREIGGEPVADIRARAAELRGCRIDGDAVALAIDEIPAVAVAAACARGATEIRGAGELRVKESDRIRGVVDALRALGIAVDEHPDGMTIHGGQLRGGAVDSHGDHRVAMAFAMAGVAADDAVEVRDCANIATSFPQFVESARAAGLLVEVAGP